MVKPFKVILENLLVSVNLLNSDITDPEKFAREVMNAVGIAERDLKEAVDYSHNFGTPRCQCGNCKRKRERITAIETQNPIQEYEETEP